MKIFYCSVVLLALVAFVLAVGILKPTFRFKNGIMHKQAMQLTSSAFSEGQTLPSRFSYGGGNVNPPLAWSGAPEGTRSFALIMDDPDVPKGVGVPIWIHWIVFNIPSSATGIPEAAHLVGVRGKGTSGSVDYYGRVRQIRNIDISSAFMPLIRFSI